MEASQVKVAWEGEVVSVQPRSTVWRTHVGHTFLLDDAVVLAASSRLPRKKGPHRL